LLDQLGVTRFAVYIQDYGAPVGLRVASAHPERFTDEILGADGARAYLRDLPDAELHLLDAGHFALESHRPEIAALIRDFLPRTLNRTTS